jgi:hypothetical protein
MNNWSFLENSSSIAPKVPTRVPTQVTYSNF